MTFDWDFEWDDGEASVERYAGYRPLEVPGGVPRCGNALRVGLVIVVTPGIRP